MSAERNKEEQALLVAWGHLDPNGPIQPTSPAGEPPDPTLVREYTELLGLLPYELEPELPRPELWQQLRAAIQSEAAAGTAEEAPAAATDEGVTPTQPRPKRPIGDLTLIQSPTRHEVDEMALHHPGAADAVDMTLIKSPSERATPPPLPQSVPFRPPAVTRPTAPPARSSWGTVLLAAMLGVCLLGLGFFAGKMNEQRATIARLEEDFTALQAEHNELLEAKKHLDMVTAVARHIYRMQPIAETAQQASAQGIVYVCGKHKRWYLYLQGLEPAPSGYQYYLWFKTRQGMESGGAVEVRHDAPYEAEAHDLPVGTQGFLVTLEKAGAHEEPEGEIMLLGEKSVSL